MKYMNIGNSDVKASIITLGAWSIGGGSWWKNTEDELSIKTIHRALELGINTIDTAPIYGLGHSEEIVGKGLVLGGTLPNGRLVEIVELPQSEHPWFLGAQFHPEFKSRPTHPHPLFKEFVGAAVKHHK